MGGPNVARSDQAAALRTPSACSASIPSAKTGTRTQDLRITNALLYQLSYLGVGITANENTEKLKE